MKKREQGLFLVEFAVIAVVLVILLFGVIELSRIIWVWNTADEATRRGARVAAVCPINHPAVPEATIFAQAGSGGPSPVLRGLTTANVQVSYLDVNGDPETTFSDIKFVRVALVNYTLTPLIPFIDRTFTLPRIETTIPSESLGLIPDPDNPTAAAVCGCFGSNTACQP
jgi:Flp pilus assembly protein TadG